MKRVLILVSFAGLALTIIPSVLVFTGIITMKLHYQLMAAGFVVWFISAPFWMKSKSIEEE